MHLWRKRVYGKQSLCLSFNFALNLKLQQAEMENQLNKDMTLVVENLRSLRHDMNNHLSVLNGLMSMQEYEDAQNTTG